MLGLNSIHLALARDGLIKEQAAAVLLVQTGVLESCGARTALARYAEWLEVVG